QATLGELSHQPALVRSPAAVAIGNEKPFSRLGQVGNPPPIQALAVLGYSTPRFPQNPKRASCDGPALPPVVQDAAPSRRHRADCIQSNARHISGTSRQNCKQLSVRPATGSRGSDPPNGRQLSQNLNPEAEGAAD